MMVALVCLRCDYWREERGRVRVQRESKIEGEGGGERERDRERERESEAKRGSRLRTEQALRHIIYYAF